MGSGHILAQIHYVTSGKSQTRSGPQCPLCVVDDLRALPTCLFWVPLCMCVCCRTWAEWWEEGHGGFRASLLHSVPHPHTAFCRSPFRFQSAQHV